MAAIEETEYDAAQDAAQTVRRFQALTKEITRLEKSNVRLSVTVPAEEARSQYQDMLKEYVKNVQLPGFRRGKVPQNVLERKFGESLKIEALGHIIEDALKEIFDDLKVEDRPLPYSAPQLEGESKPDFDHDLQFSVVYDVLPSVTAGQWKGLEVEAPSAEVTEADIARELEEVRERNAIVLDRDEGAAAQTGDIVTVDYCELDENGEALPGSERKDFVFTLGGGISDYQFDSDICGMKKGETKTFTKTYDDSAGAALAGLTKKLRVTLAALKEKKLPVLDDELAQDVDEQFHTLDDLKNSIRGRLEKNLERRLREIKINALLEKIMEQTPVTLPDSMVRIEMEGRLRNLARRFNTSSEQVMQMLSQSGGDLDNEWRPGIEKSLHSRLIVETLMKEQKLEAGDEDIEKEIEAMAAERDVTPESFKKYFMEEGMKEYLVENIKERKFFDLLLAENTVKPGKKETYMDLVPNNG